MASNDQKLVDEIARQVLQALRERGQLPPGSAPWPAASPPASGAPSRAEVHPPVGTCTGDYSKFTELGGGGSKRSFSSGRSQAELGNEGGGGRGEAAPAPRSASAPGGASPAVEVIPLTGIITGNQLQSAMDAAADGVAVIASDARLTPLANDLARAHPERVCRAGAAAAGTASGPAAPWLWWIDGHCGSAEQIASQRAGRLRLCGTARSPQSIAQVARDLAAAIRSGRVCGGLLFVHNAARAMCYLNRCASIRAVVGTCGEAVEQGIAELGANALVIEYPHQGPRAMVAMVDRMLAQVPKAPAAVQRDLADLHRCG